MICVSSLKFLCSQFRGSSFAGVIFGTKKKSTSALKAPASKISSPRLSGNSDFDAKKSIDTKMGVWASAKIPLNVKPKLNSPVHLKIPFIPMKPFMNMAWLMMGCAN
jgi:hypothetical protein